ncbi:MAG TPA: hypothetical protein VNO83_03815 [Pseudonocardia sp.]|nr:hypothetical protein [Pseudonocardia sp.]
MLDVGPAAESGDAERDEDGEAADLAIFVDRLAAAGSDHFTGLARTQIRRAIGEGGPPPGVRRLAEALAAAMDRPPAPRPSADSSDSAGPAAVVSAVRANTLVVLENFDPAETVAALDALLADGKRVVVTGPDQMRCARLQQAMPARTAGRVLDRLPELSSGELRELRSLLATSTAARRARADQELPATIDLPAPAEVAELCRQCHQSGGPGPSARMVPDLLRDVEPGRRAAVTSVARLVDRSLTALPSPADCAWAWPLLENLVLCQHRAVFDGMLEDTAQAVTAVQQGRNCAPVVLTTRADADMLGLLRQYRDFLADGGRTRTFFRTALQREAQPVLEGIRVDGRAPVSKADVGRVVEYLELGEWLRRVCAGCGELGIPAPRDDEELRRLHDVLVAVAVAARSVSALRHDVLFLTEDSPLSVPDVKTAAEVAAAVLDYEVYGSGIQAARRLDTMAERLAARCAIAAMSPEHERACTALRERDAAGYADAAEALVAARREQHDERRRTTLLLRLGAAAPRLAAAWTALADQNPAALGMAVFLPMEQLLANIPPPDSADVLLLAGAVDLGIEHLLLTAVAPRLVAAVGPDDRPAPPPTLLSVLERADALTIRRKPVEQPAAAVVPITAGATPRAVRSPSMQQAGA